MKRLNLNKVGIALVGISAVICKLAGNTVESIWFLCVLIYFCLTEERKERKEEGERECQ